MSVASTTSAPTPVVVGVVAEVAVASSPVLKPVPSSIFLPLRLSLFLFSFVTASALIDFRIVVNELISFAFASTSVWDVELEDNNNFASSTNFSAFSICDFCCSLERIRLISVCNADTFSCNSAVWRVWEIFVSTFFSSTTPVTAGCSVALLSLLRVLSTDVWVFIFLSPKASLLAFTTLSVFVTSLASTWYPKKKPAPTNTLAAPTFNFLIEYFSNFRPDFCWFK